MPPFEIIAHRGSSFTAPENTLAAVELAWREGADAVEGDFRLTKDGEIVCLHDATLKRTTGIDRAIADCTLAELQTIDAGSWKAANFRGEPIPTLQTLLATVAPGKRFFVEVKCGDEIVPPLARALAKSCLAAEQVVLICLDFDVCHAIKQALPQQPVYWVVNFKRNSAGDWQPTVEEVFRRVARAKPRIDGLDLMATGPIDEDLVNRAKSAGLDLCVWTVDDPTLAKRLVDLGISGITTNRPGWLREQLILA